MQMPSFTGVAARTPLSAAEPRSLRRGFLRPLQATVVDLRGDFGPRAFGYAPHSVAETLDTTNRR